MCTRVVKITLKSAVVKEKGSEGKEKKAWKDEGLRAWVTREVRFRGARYTRGKINFPSLVKSLVKAEITRVMGKSGEVTK